MKIGILASVVGVVSVLGLAVSAAPHGAAPAAGHCAGPGCCATPARATAQGTRQAMPPAGSPRAAKAEAVGDQVNHPAPGHGLIGRRTPEGILMSADELGLTDVQKGRLLQIAERARKDAEAVLTPEQREAFAAFTAVVPVCGCGHVVVDTPAATQHTAHGTCLCPHCVAARGAAVGSDANQ